MDRGSKPARTNSSRDSISKMTNTKKGLVEWLKVLVLSSNPIKKKKKQNGVLKIGTEGEGSSHTFSRRSQAALREKRRSRRSRIPRLWYCRVPAAAIPNQLYRCNLHTHGAPQEASFMLLDSIPRVPPQLWCTTPAENIHAYEL
jgi:hypothetical protein